MAKDIYHVEPRNDLKPHNTTGEYCACQPTIENLPDRQLIIHHSYDGREFFEDRCEQAAQKGH